MERRPEILFTTRVCVLIITPKDKTEAVVLVLNLSKGRDARNSTLLCREMKKSQLQRSGNRFGIVHQRGNRPATNLAYPVDSSAVRRVLKSCGRGNTGTGGQTDRREFIHPTSLQTRGPTSVENRTSPPRWYFVRGEPRRSQW